MVGVLAGGLEKGIQALWSQEWSWPEWRETEPRHGGSVGMRGMQWREGSMDKVCDWGMDGLVMRAHTGWWLSRHACTHGLTS